MNKAQSAVEYLMIIAVTLGIIVPIAYLFYKYSSESNVKLIDSQVNQIGLKLIKNAETVYYSGKDSKVTLELNMPRSVNDIYIIDDRELVFNITTETGEIEAVFFSQVSITSADCQGNICKLSELADLGLNRAVLASVNDGKQVLITEQTT